MIIYPQTSLSERNTLTLYTAKASVFERSAKVRHENESNSTKIRAAVVQIRQLRDARTSDEVRRPVKEGKRSVRSHLANRRGGALNTMPSRFVEGACICDGCWHEILDVQRGLIEVSEWEGEMAGRLVDHCLRL